VNRSKPYTAQSAGNISEDKITSNYPGLEAISSLIVRTTVETCTQHFHSSLRTIILTGSLARGEGTIEQSQLSATSSGDAEFILILHCSTPLPPLEEIRALMTEIERQISDHGVHCHVDLTCAHSEFLKAMRPHMFAYETRTCGRVVAGHPNILSLIPAFTPSEIPLEDAWRLLSNRMVELIEALAESDDGLGPRVQYRTIKLYLDMATSLLLFAGQYAPSYRERCNNLRKLVSDKQFSFPFSPALFLTHVEESTALKLSRTPLAVVPDPQWVRTACNYAFLLWKWQIRQITGLPQDLSPIELCLGAMARQPKSARIRGWIFALRRYRGDESLKTWLRWLRLARRASPRYCVYAVTGELYLRRYVFVEKSSTDKIQSSPWNLLWDYLPEVSKTLPIRRDFRELGTALAWNYHKYLEGTRA
jgi:hypothetical protein